jgi:EAL domain-containing protein (putative c-di-GMP-specific phosphodiesterase class I)
MGCDLAPGYFIARPLDEAAFAQFCRSYAPVG